MTAVTQIKPEDEFFVFWDCDGVLANNSEALAMPIAGVILNEAMKALHPNAPQFDIEKFVIEGAGGHFSQFYERAAKMLYDFDPTLAMPPEKELDILKVDRTVAVLTEQARPAADLSAALQKLAAVSSLKQCVVSSSELNRVLPCVEKIEGYDFGGAWEKGGTGTVISAADTMEKVFGRRVVKPAPDVAHFAATVMGVTNYKKTVAVEDSPSGVKCWVAAGIPVVGYTGGDHIVDKEAHKKMLLDLGAVAVFETMAKVADHILLLRQQAMTPNTAATFKATATPTAPK